MITYPEVDVDELQILLELVRERGASFLLDPECPYPSSLVDLLLEHRGDGAGDADEDVGEMDLVAESERILRELRDQKETLGESDHSEAMAYFRTSVAVLEKLVSMKERANNVRQVSEFYRIVMGVMEEFLEPAEITQLRERLKEFGV